jgi:hypothetical protein
MNYYTYTVRFVDGHYYHGYAKSRGGDPLTDGYFGSPVTNKEKWLTTMHWKEITGTYETLDAVTFAEQEAIRPVFREDPFCLNAACNGLFSKEASVLGGKVAGAKAAESGQILAIKSFESCQLGGQRGSTTLMEKKLGLFGMSPEKVHATKVNGAAAQHQQRWMNTHPDFEPFISTPCGLSSWQKARGIDKKFRVKLSN